jgi:hypothetical protein
MYKACKMGQFPSIEVMCRYGLSGYRGTNPVNIFDCYRRAIKDGVTESDLEDAMEKGTLNDLIMKSPSVQSAPYYLKVMQQGGIQVPDRTSYECNTCGMYSTKQMCNC